MAFLDNAGLEYTLTKVLSKITQPNWNVNDENDPAYVKNRPFYSSEPIEITIIEEQTVTFVEDADMYIAQNPFSLLLEEGVTYTVYWQGQPYNVTCANIMGLFLGIGNMGFMGLEDTGEPFAILYNHNGGECIVASPTAGDATVKIVTIQEDIEKLPVKYLPDGYPCEEYIDNYKFADNFMFSISQDGGSIDIESPDTFLPGETYTVTYDNVQYICTASIIPLLGNIFIGNTTIDSTVNAIVGGEDILGKGEPFLIIDEGNGHMSLCASNASIHMISIVGKVKKIHTMDKKFLPDDINASVNIEAITNDEIDTICGVTIVNAEGETF